MNIVHVQMDGEKELIYLTRKIQSEGGSISTRYLAAITYDEALDLRNRLTNTLFIVSRPR